jgi:cytochrome c peroxidase
VAVGVFGRRGHRNAPALVNRGYGRAFFWDGRAAVLEEQVLQPIQDENEMDLTLAEASVRMELPADEISRALASYIRSILSGDSPFDRFVHGDRGALSAEQQRGLQIFRGKGNCTACHVGPNFTDEQFHNTGVAWLEGGFSDRGRAAVTGRREDEGAFKTPTLREAALSAPYMHDGSLATLDAVVEFYENGGRKNPTLDPEIRTLRLSEDEKQAIVAFLQSLSGRIQDGVQ